MRLPADVARKYGIPYVADGDLCIIACIDAADFVDACTKERLAVLSVSGFAWSERGAEPDESASTDFSGLLGQDWDDFLVLSLVQAHRFLRTFATRDGKLRFAFRLMAREEFPRVC
jgi:hypothetical protein